MAGAGFFSQFDRARVVGTARSDPHRAPLVAVAVGGERVLVAVDGDFVGTGRRIVVLRRGAFEIGEGLVGLAVKPFTDELGLVAGDRLGAFQVVEHGEAVAAAGAVSRQRGECQCRNGVGVGQARLRERFQLVQVPGQFVERKGASAQTEAVGNAGDVAERTAAGGQQEGGRGAAEESRKSFHGLVVVDSFPKLAIIWQSGSFPIEIIARG